MLLVTETSGEEGSVWHPLGEIRLWSGGLHAGSCPADYYPIEPHRPYITYNYYIGYIIY